MFHSLQKLSREKFYWFSFCALMVPLSFLYRFLGLENPLLETQPLRQAQTALTIRSFARNEISFWDYSSPMGGFLWNYVREFPLYQWALSWGVKAGYDITLVARLGTLAFFFASVPYLYFLLKRVVSKEAARWATTFYLVLPFTGIYSRACLVDMVALSFVIAGAFYSARFLEESRRSDWFWATLLLIIGGSIKVTIWFALAGIGGLYFSWLRGQKDYRKALPVLLSLAVQFLLVGAWLYWAEKAYYRTGNESGQSWLLGNLAVRTSWESYERFFNNFRFVMNGWLWVPFCLGLYACRKDPIQLGLILLVTFLPVLIFFNVSLYHDYYFLSALIPVLYLSGIGVSQWMKLPLKGQAVVLTLFIALFLNSLRGVAGNFGNTLAQRADELIPFERLVSLTDPSDVLYPDEFSDSILPTYFSDRLVAQIPAIHPDKVKTSVFYFQTEESLLKDYVRDRTFLAILESFGGMYVYRVEDRGRKVFDPSKHLAVLSKALTKEKATLERQENYDLCGKQEDFFLVKNISGLDKVLEISFDRVANSFILPSGNYLSIPVKSPWGCKVRVSPRPPKHLRKTLLALK